MARVAEVQQSFQVIFLLFGLVVPLVTGLFFLIITLQKSASLTLLRAVGAKSGLLVRSLMFQVVLVIGGGLLIGIALYTPLSQAQLWNPFETMLSSMMKRTSADRPYCSTVRSRSTTICPMCRL